MALQETHGGSAEDLKSRRNLSYYHLIGATYERAYGAATYVRSNIENTASTNNNIHEVIIMKEITIINVTKLPQPFGLNMYSELTTINFGQRTK